MTMVHVLAETKEVLDPVSVSIAVLAWICVYGFNLLKTMVGGILNSVPLIGRWLGNVVAFDFPEISTFWSAIHPVPDATTAISVNHATEQGLSIQAHAAAHGAISRVQNVTLPSAVNAATIPIASQLTQDRASTGAFEANVNAFYAWTHSEDSYLRNQTDVVIPSEIRSAWAALDQVGVQANTTLPAALAQERSDRGAAIDQLRTTVAGDLGALHGTVEQDIQTAADNAQAGAIAAVEPQIGSLVTDLGGLAQTIAGPVVGSIGVLQTLTGSLAGRLTQVEECTGEICATGSGPTLGNLGKILQQLGTLLAADALFAFVAAAAANPAGVAGDVESVVSPIADLAVTGFRDLTGISG